MGKQRFSKFPKVTQVENITAIQGSRSFTPEHISKAYYTTLHAQIQKSGQIYEVSLSHYFIPTRNGKDSHVE